MKRLEDEKLKGDKARELVKALKAEIAAGAAAAAAAVANGAGGGGVEVGANGLGDVFSGVVGETIVKFEEMMALVRANQELKAAVEKQKET